MLRPVAPAPPRPLPPVADRGAGARALAAYGVGGAGALRPVEAIPGEGGPAARPTARPAPHGGAATRIPDHGAARARAADLAAVSASADAWRSDALRAGEPVGDVEVSIRVLADGGSITVARQVVDGHTRHVSAVVR